MKENETNSLLMSRKPKLLSLVELIAYQRTAQVIEMLHK